MIYKIVCAGVDDLKKIYQYNDGEVIIAVDGGYQAIKKLNLEANYFFGDCDSLPNKYKKILIENVENCNLYKSEKDQTDLELALTFAISKYNKEDKIVIYNVTGKRLDHYEGAIRLLKQFSDYNIEIVNKNNVIKVYEACENLVFEKDNYKYISFFNIYPETIISLRGFKYPLDNYKMNENDYLCISNQIIYQGIVSVNKNILVIKSK